MDVMGSLEFRVVDGFACSGRAGEEKLQRVIRMKREIYHRPEK